MLTVDALVCVEPGQLRLEQRPAPARRADQVLVRPRRVGICGTDYHIFEGKHPFLQYPRVMGHELAVEVVEAAGRLRPDAGRDLRRQSLSLLRSVHRLPQRQAELLRAASPCSASTRTAA